MAYLEGTNISPKTIKDAAALIGKEVIYLRQCDIDHSGRGMIFPRTGYVEGVKGRNILMHNDAIYMNDLVEMCILSQTNEEESPSIVK